MANINNTKSNSLVSGTAYADTIKNTANGATIVAYAGNDSVNNSSDYVSIDGGDDNDKIYNTGANVTISGGENKDTVDNRGDFSIINTGAGEDSVYNRGNNVTINTGDDKDKISNSGNYALIDSGYGNDYINNINTKSYYVTIDSGAGNDEIYNNSANSSINAGDGNDSISNRSYASLNAINGGAGDDSIRNYYAHDLSVTGGDGDDTVYGFDELTTLQIGNGTDTYATLVSGNDVIIYVGDGSILLNGGAKLGQINITGQEQEFPILRYIGNNTVTYGQQDNPFVTISDVKSTTGISVNGKAITIANYALNKSNVTVNNSEYTLQLGYDVPTSTTTEAGWTLNNSIANYNTTAISEGYLLANNQIYFISASGGETLITLNGVNSLDGISLNGSMVTLSNSALKNSNVTINSGYTLALGNNVTRSETTVAHWDLNGTTATYKSDATTAGYVVINNQIYYINASGGDNLITLSGVKSLKGLSFDGNIVMISNSALNKGTVTVSDGYILKLDDDVVTPKTTEAGWNIDGTTAIYKTASNTAGYTLKDNQITYTTASSNKTLATISGVKSMKGLTIDDKVVTVSKVALGTVDISISKGYTLVLGDDVKKAETKAAGWTLSGTTATYKAASNTAGYKLDNNQISYVKASGGKTLVTVKGVKSTNGLTLKDNVVTVAKSSLNAKKVTVSNGYTLQLSSDVTKTSTKKAWSIKSSTATYKQTTKAGYSLANNAISYSKRLAKL